MKTWRRFWQTSGDARARVLQAAGGLLVTRAGVRLAGFRKWKAAIERLTRMAKARELSAHDEMAIASAMARSEAAAARHLPLKLTCLDRALTLWWLLRKRGIAAELRIGGRKKSGEFEAHAWVELGGAELGASNFDSRHFATFERPMTARGARAL